MEAVKKYLDRDGLELYDSLLKDMIGEIAGRNIVSIDDNPDGSITITYTDGTTWTSEPLAGRVTGVKGNAENSYREGDVNITLDDIGLTANDITDALGYTPVGTDFHVAQTATTGNFDRRVLLSATDTDTTETSTTFKNGDFTYNASTGVLTVPHIAGNPGEVISALEPSAEDQVTGDYWIKVISTQQDGTKIVQKYQKQGDGTYAPITEAVSASAVTLSSGNTVQDFIGTTSISDVGDGSITGAISTLNTAVNNIDVSSKLDKASSAALSGNKVVTTNSTGKAVASSVTATDLEGFDGRISNAATAASNAATAAAAAQSTADGAATTASSAYTRSGTAINTANSAASDASTALSRVGDRLATAEGGTTLGTNKVVITDGYGKAKASSVTASDLANMSSNISTAVSTANSASSTASSALTEANKKLETINDTKTLAGNMVVITSSGGYATTGNVSSSELNMLDGISTTAGSIESRLTNIASDASTAKSNASTALSTANSASTAASTASTNASTAISNSNARLATANSQTTLNANKVVITDNYGKATNGIDSSYLTGVTSNVQTQLNNKASSTHTHYGSEIAMSSSDSTKLSTAINNKANASDLDGKLSSTASTLAGSMVVVTNSSGKATTSTSITSTELNALDGINSNVQNQLDNLRAEIEQQSVLGGRKDTSTVGTSPKALATRSISSPGLYLVLGYLVVDSSVDLQIGISYGTSSTIDTNAKWLSNRATTDKIMTAAIVPVTSSTTYIGLLGRAASNVTVKGGFSSIPSPNYNALGSVDFLTSTRLYIIPLSLKIGDLVAYNSV